MSKRGSATIAIIVMSIVFMLYASSTFADVRHLKNKYNDYEKYIVEQYEKEYQNTLYQL